MIISRVFLLIFFISLTYSQSNDEIASFNFIEGDCLLKNDRVYNQFHKVLPGRTIYSGDIIKTKDDSFCTIQFNDKKTYINLEANSVIQILDNDLSREIKLDGGSLYIKNIHSKTKKTYVFTSYNQIFIDHDRIWIETSYISGDHFFSVFNAFNVFNIKNNKQKNIVPHKLVSFDHLGNITESSNYSIVPDYVINEILNKRNKKNITKFKKHDLIPFYGQRIYNTKLENLYNLSFGLGTSIISDTTYIKFSVSPNYKKDNFFIGVDLTGYVNLDGGTLSKDWDDIFDVIDRTYGYYKYANHKNKMSLSFGKDIKEVSFAQGYLLNDLGLPINSPTIRTSGIYLKYKFDKDFMDLDVLIPNLRDFSNSGGILGLRTSLYISHKFPLTFGFGIVADLNQFSAISDHINKNINKKRDVLGVEFDFNYEVVSNVDKEIHIFSEFVGIWYPDYNYYTFYNDENVSNDLKWRKGVWGIKGPGFSMKMKNRYEIKFSFNINSATFIPNYFNSTYLYNRVRYYKDDDLTFPLVQQQIDMIENNFLVDGSSDEYLIPKDVYPTLFQNEGHSPYPVFGFTTEYSYVIYKYLSTSSKLSIFLEDSDDNDQYYTLETSLNINDNFIRNLLYMNIYFSNTFFSKISDQQRMIFGFKSAVKLPFRLALIINLAQVYYDSNLTNNSIDGMMNFGLDLNYNF